MTKEDIKNALSLSCVENYFLGYFKNKFDIRALYVNSFLPFDKVMDDMINGDVKYEYYPLERLQNTAELLGITTHVKKVKFNYFPNRLNLIRVNKNFFKNIKLLPWRNDHFIVIEKINDQFRFINNYPLSEGIIQKDIIAEIFDGTALVFCETDNFNEDVYEQLCNNRYVNFKDNKINEYQISKINMQNLRDALLILKISRKRLIEWVKFESERKNFADISKIIDSGNKIVKMFDDLIITLQLQHLRKTFDGEIINKKFDELKNKDFIFFNKIVEGR